MSQSSPGESGTENWKAHKRKTDQSKRSLVDRKIMKLIEVPGDAKQGAKMESASNVFYRTPKVIAILLLCMLLLLPPMVVPAVVASRRPEPPPVELSCPDGWVGYQGKCYYFSEAEGNWDSSRSRCSALGASLAGIDSLQDLAFLLRYKGRDYHWIGLRREEEAQPWKWVNGTEFNNLFNVIESENCAYLNSDHVSSSNCLTTKNWICSKEQKRLHAANRSRSRDGHQVAFLAIFAVSLACSCVTCWIGPGTAERVRSGQIAQNRDYLQPKTGVLPCKAPTSVTLPNLRKTAKSLLHP